MTFIFTPESDPRRVEAVEFKAGDKVQYRGMAMPAEVLSGPHPTTSGRKRYLVTKADGNVSLVLADDLRRVHTRLEQVTECVAMNVFGRTFSALGMKERMTVAYAASRALAIADKTRGQI